MAKNYSKITKTITVEFDLEVWQDDSGFWFWRVSDQGSQVEGGREKTKSAASNKGKKFLKSYMEKW